MRLPQLLNDAFNEQVLNELSNALLYEEMASLSDSIGMCHTAKFFMGQAREERSHAQMIIKHLNDRIGGQVSHIEGVPGHKFELSEVSQIGNLFVQAEQRTSENIESLYHLALEQNSYMDLPFLLEMLLEQSHEEAKAATFEMKLASSNDMTAFDLAMKE